MDTQQYLLIVMSYLLYKFGPYIALSTVMNMVDFTMLKCFKIMIIALNILYLY